MDDIIDKEELDKDTVEPTIIEQLFQRNYNLLTQTAVTLKKSYVNKLDGTSSLKIAVGVADNNSVEVFDLKKTSLSSICRLSGHEKSLTEVVFSQNDDQLLYTTGHDGLIKLWDLRAGGSCAQEYKGINHFEQLGLPKLILTYFLLLLQEPNVGVEYEYSVPSAMAPPPNAQYNWVHDEFTPCSASCGGGVQVRNVTCRSREELEVVEDALCEPIVKPVLNQTCNTQACPARWVEGPWSACSKRCGKGGNKSRQVHCEKIIANGYPSIVSDDECFELLGEKPPLYEKCNENASCPIWFTGPWKPCDKLCGEGKQTRQVVCYQKTNGRIDVLSDDLCDDDKPDTEQPCLLHPCDGVDWVISDWSGVSIGLLRTFCLLSGLCPAFLN
ncbi:hypothetical protein evm_013439 [Chilo suppressalis]|nr:hypothetical protein evm_013439 [Chilo suppressalis]